MKMEKPKLEVVRFSAEDVIATSGPSGTVDPFANLQNGMVPYFSALRSEADEAGLYYNDYHGPSYLFVHFTSDGNGTPYTAQELSGSSYYTWYDKGQWQTEYKSVNSYHYNKASTANWRRQ